MARLVAIILAGLAGVVGVSWLLAEWALPDLCGNTIVQVLPSPGGKWEAVLFERSCGATTGFSSQIALLEAGRSLRNDAGNIFAADGRPHGYTLRWLDDSHLEVTGAGEGYRAETEHDGIIISYR